MVENIEKQTEEKEMQNFMMNLPIEGESEENYTEINIGQSWNNIMDKEENFQNIEHWRIEKKQNKTKRMAGIYLSGRMSWKIKIGWNWNRS